MVAEDYRDEIEYILDHPAYTDEPVEAVVPVPAIDEAVAKSAYTDLAENRANFAQRLQPQHWDALAAMLSRTEVEARLNMIARSVYTTSNLLIDTINEMALDAIGDIVIDTAVDPPCIEEEDFKPLTELLNWASEHQLLEL